MIHLLDKLRSIGWNQRILTQQDFYDNCQRHGVFVVDVDHKDMMWKGFYAIRGRRPVIVLNAKLRGVEKFRVQWHELGHFWLHTPCLSFYSNGVGLLDKIEYEANVISTIALLPETVLRRMLTSHIQEEYGYPTDLIEHRLMILDRYGI